MTKTEEIKVKYWTLIRTLFAGYPEAVIEFENMWTADKFREAYLYVDDIIKVNGITLSQEQRKVDEDFYWDVIN